jgi:hypothetical protein
MMEPEVLTEQVKRKGWESSARVCVYAMAETYSFGAQPKGSSRENP